MVTKNLEKITKYKNLPSSKNQLYGRIIENIQN